MKIYKCIPILWMLFFLAHAQNALAQSASGYCGRQVGSNTDSTNLQWNYDASQHALTITGSGPMKDYSLETQAPWSDWQSDIRVVEMDEHITSIGSYALYNLSNLRHLHIPGDVAAIGNYALRGLTGLDSISVSNGNPRYDSREACNALIETSNDMLLLGCSKTRMPADIRGIESCAFLNVSGLKEAVIPEGVTYIGTEAFKGCTALDSLVLPSQLIAISAYAFQDCGRLDTLVLPETIDTIGIRAFAKCSGLRYVRSNAVAPPRIHPTTFSNTSFHIDVPCPGIAAYRSAPVWEDFDSLRISTWYELVLTTRSNNPAYGMDTILQRPDCDTAAVVYAEPYEGCEFVAWQDTLGHVLSTDSLYEFYVDEDITVVAVFRKIPEALDDVSARTTIWVNGHEVFVLTDRDTRVALFDILGRMVDARPATADYATPLHAPAAGVYVVVADGHQKKVFVP